ncbi:Bifunctional Phosphopantetheine adenylyltransferase - Dephospho-CoA kinase [Carabus blaptoides fortunei]
MIAKTGLLILTNPVHIGKILPTIRQQVKTTLYIHLANALHEPVARYKPDIFTSAPKCSQTIRGIYSQAAAICQNLDVRVLLSGLKYSTINSLNTSRPIDLVIFDKLHEQSLVDRFLDSCIINKEPGCSVLTLENTDGHEFDTTTSSKEYRHVVLGGTFDRLHIGHKILLSEAILCANEKVTVGVTDTPMLSGKTLWELIEPCGTRLEGVRDFVEDVCPGLTYSIVPIQDPFGPTQSDPTMEMIVVSAETLRGGEKVNELRQQNQLNTLDINIVDLVDCPDRQADEEAKISSSTGRMRLLGTLLRPARCTRDETGPCVIGLTGGIASGKSAIRARLAKLGAAVIDCDKVAHQVYRPGQPCHRSIQETFGDGVIGEDGEINRKALGAIVFHNKSEMEKLNAVVWPAIASEVQDRIKNLYASGERIIVVEAAVLLQAGWDRLCTEVWTCILPPDEAVRRLQDRNGLSEREARARLASQSANTELVTRANVVLCTVWSYEYTQQTVERSAGKLAIRKGIYSNGSTTYVMKMEECTILCRLEVPEHRALLDKIHLSENSATGDKNAVSIARATITIYVPPLPYPAPRAAGQRQCGNSNGASVAYSHSLADNNKLQDNRELLRKIAENYRILNRRDVPKRPTINYSIASRRVIKRTVHKTHDKKMTTPNGTDENSISKLSVSIARARLDDRLNTMLDNGTMQHASTSAAVNNIHTQEQEEMARNSSDSSTSSTDHSVASSSSLEQYLMKRYEKCRAKGECLNTDIMTRHQRELLQLREDFARMSEEEELAPVGHRKTKRMSSKMKKKQALLATFAKCTNNVESVRVSPSSSSSSDSESSGAHTSRKKSSARGACSLLETESSSSSTTDNSNETATVQSVTAIVEKRKIHTVRNRTLTRYLAHLKQKQRNNSDTSETTTNTKDEDIASSTGDGVWAGGELHVEPLVTGDVDDGGRVAVPATVQCNNTSATRHTTRKITRIQRFGRRFFHHSTIPYIKPRKRVQLRKTFSASLTNLVDKSIEISKQKGTSKMNNNGEESVTTKLRNTRKAKTPQRKRINGSQDGSCDGQSIAEQDVHSAPGAGSSTSTDAVTYKGYSICNKLNVNSTGQDNGSQHETDNENSSSGYRVTQSDKTSFEIEYENRHGTEVKNASSNEDGASTTSPSMNNDRTVENNTITISDDEACNTNAQPARDPTQPATDKIIISNVRSIAEGSDDEASGNTSTIVSQPQDNTTISVIPEYLLQSRQPPDAPSSSKSTGRNEQSTEVQPSNDDERLLDINRRLHHAHQTPNNSNGSEQPKLTAQVRPKRTYVRKQNTNTEEAMFHQYQQIQQQNQQQLSQCLGQQQATREMYELSPDGRTMIAIHQYQYRERMSVPVTSPQPPSYRNTVNNMINPNIPRLPMAARQSMNIPFLPPPPAYPSHLPNPMIHPPPPPPYPSIPVNPMLPTPALPTSIGPMPYKYPITIVPPSSRAAVNDDDIYMIRPMPVLENQQYTVTGPRPPERRASVQSPPTHVRQPVHSALQRGTVQSPVDRKAQPTANHTVESMIRSASVQSPRQVAGRGITVQAQVHPPPYQRAQRNHTPASTSTERVKVEHLAYAPPIEDIVNKVVQSPQDRIRTPTIPEDRVPSPTREQNVVPSVARDTDKSPAQSKLLAVLRSPSGTKVVKLEQPVTQVTVHSSAARQEPDVHSCTPVEALRTMVSATNDRDVENVENQQVTTAESEETLTASDSDTFTSEEVNNIEAGQSLTVCNTSANVEQSENNNDVVIPASASHTPRARPRIRNRLRVRRYWQTPSAVRFSRTVRFRRLVNRQNYTRRRIERSTPVMTQQDTTTMKKCKVKSEQTTETSSLVPSTSRKDNADPCEHQTPDRMNVPVNFYSQTDEPPVYVSTVISQGIEALQLAQVYLDTFQNNHDTMRDLQQALRELIANTGHGEHTDSRISHTEHLLKQFLHNQRNIRAEFVIRQDVVSGHNDTQPTNNPRAIFTVQRLQEALEKLAEVLTQLRDSAAPEHEQQRTSDEQQPSTEQRDTINDEPVVNLQLPWSRAKNIVVDNSQPSTSRVTSTPAPQEDVKYMYALGKLEERKLDNTKCPSQPSPAVITREEKEIVTELLDNGVTIQCSIPVHTTVDPKEKPDEENSNGPSVSGNDTSANNIPEPRIDIPPSPQTNIPSHQSTTSGPASGIVGPCCQICCSFAKHEAAKRNTRKTSTTTNNEQSTLITGNQEQQQQQQSMSQPTARTLVTVNQQQPISQSTELTLTTVKQQQVQKPTSEPREPTLITVNQQQPMSQSTELTLTTVTQQQVQKPTSEPTEPTLITPLDPTLLNANQQREQQLAMAQPIVSSVRDTRAVSTYNSRPVQLTEHIHIPCTIDIPPILGTNNGRLQIMVPQPTLVINRPQILTTTGEVPLAIESENNTSHHPPVEDATSVIPSPNTSHTHLAATSERRTSDGECLLPTAAYKTEYLDARTQSSTSASHSNKRHVTDTPSTDDGSKRARTSDPITPAAGQSVPSADFMAAVNQRLENTESLIRTLIHKKDRKRCTGTATAVRDEEVASQSSATSLFSERAPLSSYNVPTYQRSIYSTQQAVRPESYHTEQYARQRGAVTPFQQPARLPSRYVAYQMVPASVPLHSPMQPSDYPLTSVDGDHPRRRSEPLPQYIPVTRRTNMDMTMSSPPPPPSILNHHEYRSRRSSHRGNPSASGTVQPGSAQPHQELFIVQVPPFPAEVLHGKQYNTLLRKYYQEPSEHALMKYTLNYPESKHTKTKGCKQVIQAKSYPHHVHSRQQNIQCDCNKTYIPAVNSENNTKHPQSVVVSEHDGGAKHAIEMVGARLQVEQLNSFIENNRRMLLQDSEPCIRPATLSKYAVTDPREIHRLFDIVALRDSDQYYRSLWCMWSVAENKHLYEFYRTVTQLQIRAGQTPFTIRIFIQLLRCKYFGSVRKLTEDQCKQ